MCEISSEALEAQYIKTILTLFSTVLISKDDKPEVFYYYFVQLEFVQLVEVI